MLTGRSKIDFEIWFASEKKMSWFDWDRGAWLKTPEIMKCAAYQNWFDTVGIHVDVFGFYKCILFEYFGVAINGAEYPIEEKTREEAFFKAFEIANEMYNERC